MGSVSFFAVERILFVDGHSASDARNILFVTSGLMLEHQLGVFSLWVLELGSVE